MVAGRSRVIWHKKNCKKFIFQPSQYDNKYSRGVLGLITGSNKYPGAAVLTANAAVKTGVGLVRFQPIRRRDIYSSRNFVELLVLTSVPEVVTVPGKVSAWLLGSGISKSDGIDTWLRQRDFSRARKQSAPTILDAGALHLAGELKAPTLITPHYGELSELLNSRAPSKAEHISPAQIAANPSRWAINAANSLGVNVLLKGAITFVTDGDKLIELPPATPWLATAGTGDVLAGIIGALFATNAKNILEQKFSIIEIAATAALIHGEAAKKASLSGPISASSIITEIPYVIRELMRK